MSRPIRIGTRGSQLALIQAESVKHTLLKRDPAASVEIVVIKTTGDADQRPFSEVGNKNIFIRELEHALLEERIDIAVHCFKDVTSDLHPKLSLSSFLAPESVRDALISCQNETLSDLRNGAIVATSSLRRKALLAHLRPDIKTVDIRGNVDTRLQKLDAGGCDAIILSEAGLIRMGLSNRISERLEPSVFVPAPGQGVVTLQTRSDDEMMVSLCADISDPCQHRVSQIEYRILQILEFNCSVPFGLWSVPGDETVEFKAFLADSSLRYHVVLDATVAYQDTEAVDRFASELKRLREATPQ